MRLRIFDDIEARLSRVRLVDDKLVYHIPREGDSAPFPGVPAINHFGLWNEQTARLTQNRPLNPPAVFIEFLPTSWGQLSRKSVAADLSIRLHIITATLAQTDTPYRDEALMRLRLVRVIKRALAGFSGEPDDQGRSFSTFRYLESLTDHNHEQVCEDIEGWQTHCIDCADVDDGLIISPKDVTLDTGDIFDNQFASQMV